MMTRAGALLAACLLLSQAAFAGDTAVSKFKRAVFERERATRDVRHVADWVVHAGDNHAGVIDPGENQSGDDVKLPFVILDKKDARVYVFNPAGRLLGAAPALLGAGIGDTALPGIGQKELSDIAPKDRISPAGRFVSELGTDNHGEDVLFMDYEGGYALHRVITTNPKEKRAHRLATPTPLDNRISWGCINVPVKFYESVVNPAFKGTKGVVYVLPETKPVHKVFALYDIVDDAPAPAPAPLQAAPSPVRRVSASIPR